MMSYSHSSLRTNRLCTIGIALAATFMTLMLGPPCALAEEEDGAWPREIEAEGGTIVVYQPQLESFEGNKLSSRAAVSAQRR